MMSNVGTSGRNPECQVSPEPAPGSPRLLHGSSNSTAASMPLNNGPNGTSTAGEPIELNAILGQASPIITTKREPQDLRFVKPAPTVTLVSSKSGEGIDVKVESVEVTDHHDGTPGLTTVVYTDGYSYVEPMSNHYQSGTGSASSSSSSVSVPAVAPVPRSVPRYPVPSSDPYYYKEYYAGPHHQPDVYGIRHPYDVMTPPVASGLVSDGVFVDRYVRHGGYRSPGQVLSVDLPSPDSGIGAEAVTPRDHVPVHQVRPIQILA